MNIAGLDYSMNGPALTLNNKDDLYTFFWTNTKKYQNKYKVNEVISTIQGFPLPEYDCNEERFGLLADEIIEICEENNITQMYIESFSYGSKGKVFEIGELFGVLKDKLWENDVKIHTIAPTTVKKFATGKGNANKEFIEIEFVKNIKLDIRKIIDQPNGENPISDIIDSYYIWLYGYTENLNYRF